MSSRIEIFRMMLEGDPGNTAVWFGLAKEYEKEGRHVDVIETLTEYLSRADDEGNAYGMLARAYLAAGDRDGARRSYARGAEVALAHGHPSMAEEYRETLASDFAN